MRLAAAAFLALLGLTSIARADCDLAAPDAGAAGPGCAQAWMDRNLRLDDIVTIGTHNSYKAKIPDKIMALLRARAPRLAEGLDYAHRPLALQLDDGARAIEIDVVYDPKGGLYAHPAGAALTGEVMPEDWIAAMNAPGFKVMHVQDLDFHTVCATFVLCLKDLKAWSDAHPRHIPILVTLNAKDDAIPMPGSVTPLKFDAAAYDALEAEILSVMPRESLVTPDDVRGDAATLRDAVVTRGWPALGETRGKFIFALDEHGAKIKPFLDGHPSLKGRVMFVNAPLDSPEAAFLVLNETSDIPAIRDAVHENFLIRTRADADTVEARSNDTSRRDKALASGAQYVSTDYMVPDTRFGDYTARMPAGVIAACNPERHPERCAGMPVEP